MTLITDGSFAQQWDLWTNFRLRLMSSAAVQIYLWVPDRTKVFPKRVELVYTEVVEDRETVNGSLFPSTRGWRSALSVTLETVEGYFAGSTSSSPMSITLEQVIAARANNTGSYYELSLAATGLSSYDYKRVNLRSGWKPQSLGPSAAQSVALEFEGAELQTDFPSRDYSYGSAW